MSTYIKLQSNQLGAIGVLARNYARLEQIPSIQKTSEDRYNRRRIVDSIAPLNAMEVAYFCQQVASHYSDIALACMALTVLTNRLHETPIRIDREDEE